MATLLALKRHVNEPDCPKHALPPDINQRISKATSALQQCLCKWDVLSTRHVGLEVLIPALLKNLEEDSNRFLFPGCEKLLKLQSKKLARVDSERLYSKKKTTLLHSMEAFVGSIDFSRV